MKPFFVQIKCELGKAYAVATAIADAEIASEIYSTAGGFDLSFEDLIPRRRRQGNERLSPQVHGKTQTHRQQGAD